MFEKVSHPDIPSVIAPTSAPNPVRNHPLELPKGRRLDKKLVGGVPLIGLTSLVGSNRPDGVDEAQPGEDRNRNLELLLLGIDPFDGNGQSDSPIKQAPPSPDPLYSKCGDLHSERDEGNSHKRQRKTELSCARVKSAKSLRFECSSDEEPPSRTTNRRGTPYKHSRQIKIED
jgi:hypothetical protein